MNSSSTNKLLLQITIPALAILLILLLTGAANLPILPEANNQDTTKTFSDDGEEIYSFYEKENGDRIKYEVHFNDGEITSLYKNGEKVPDDQIENYEDLVHSRLTDLSFKPKTFVFNFDEFDWDQEKFREDMKKFREDMDKHKMQWFSFDKEELRKNMDELKENLKELKNHKFKFEFDGKELKEQLEKLQKELRELNEDSLNIEVNIDKIQIELDEALSSLDENLLVLPHVQKHIEILANKNGKLHHSVKVYKDKTGKHKEFAEKLRDKLTEDGLIAGPDEFESFEMTNENLYINGIKQPEAMLEKYKSFYKDYFDKQLDKDFKIIIKE